jgi:hypothetical protein
MELSFENHHVVAVVVFMVALLFCKQVLECLQHCMQLWQHCALIAGCCHYAHEELLQGGLLAALLTFSVCQPVVFVLVSAFANTLLGRPGFWTINFVHVAFNASAFPHRHSQTEALRRPLTQGERELFIGTQFSILYTSDMEVTTTQVDGLLLIMPFALCVFCTTYTWFSMKAGGDFSGDPMWDAELFSSRRMQLYEALYALETTVLLFALLAITADPAQLEYTLV